MTPGKNGAVTLCRPSYRNRACRPFAAIGYGRVRAYAGSSPRARLGLVACLAGTLAACGGGSSGGSTPFVATIKEPIAAAQGGCIVEVGPGRELICDNDSRDSVPSTAAYFMSEIYAHRTSSTGAPLHGSTWYLGDPGGFSAAGTVFAASRETFGSAPIPSAGFAPDSVGLSYTDIDPNAATGVVVPGQPFTCTLYVGSKLIGSASAVAAASSSSNVVGGTAVCFAFPTPVPSTDPGSGATVGLPPTVDTSGVFTILLSH